MIQAHASCCKDFTVCVSCFKSMKDQGAGIEQWLFPKTGSFAQPHAYLVKAKLEALGPCSDN